MDKGVHPDGGRPIVGTLIPHSHDILTFTLTNVSYYIHSYV